VGTGAAEEVVGAPDVVVLVVVGTAVLVVVGTAVPSRQVPPYLVQMARGTTTGGKFEPPELLSHKHDSEVGAGVGASRHTPYLVQRARGTSTGGNEGSLLGAQRQRSGAGVVGLAVVVVSTHTPLPLMHTEMGTVGSTVPSEARQMQ